MLEKILSDINKNKSVRLNNVTCTYCGVDITKNNDSKEHVIGRKFVPKGAFDNQWNLIVQACKSCNGKKSDLENDISAITLDLCSKFHPDVSELVIIESKRKSDNCFSRQTKKLVKNSSISDKITLPFCKEVEMNFSYQAPAQLDDVRCFDLARYHLMAFFYFITFNDKTMKGGFWQEGYHPVFQAHYSDWGNVQQISFMNKVRDWELRWKGITANGFFKIIIKKHPSKKCWSWALEWNKSYRLVGFFGCRKTAEEVVKNIPPLQWKVLNNEQERKQYYREENTLDAFDDILFSVSNETK
ncbi:hypothetical protein C0W42_20725 [Photobacterium kishitanii]|uniref:HNH endonuclease n=1 Tax=Photobacterium kishitanii TaxID=318456 RepID=UPI000D177F18|nr:hypothetical protein [Photobacterium kishitanii]PSU86428.1 hypothetical protein C0W42_20725 [Photobacterium kishitanii]